MIVTLLPNWLPPTRENWELLNTLWQFFPLVTVLQWATDFWPGGKTSIQSKYNIPGKIGWATMEAPGFINLLYLVYTLPQMNGIEKLPTANKVMVILFTLHYVYRSILSPLLNPSMSPIHPFIWVSAATFQLINSTCIGGWLGAYGPTTLEEWGGKAVSIEVGIMIFALGFMGNVFHDDELREVRRAAARKEEERQEKEGKKDGKKKNVDKVYMIPKNGFFPLILFPHYFFEWIEWGGYWVIGGIGCVPARSFLINEIATMLPRALAGKRWYIQRFGAEEIGSRKAVIPGII
ncbi:hypothetical protein MMC25_002006 [Agyrium rufum]|nr:hypothetical protein [Agyrium rufum]